MRPGGKTAPGASQSVLKGRGINVFHFPDASLGNCKALKCTARAAALPTRRETRFRAGPPAGGTWRCCLALSLLLHPDGVKL